MAAKKKPKKAKQARTTIEDTPVAIRVRDVTVDDVLRDYVNKRVRTKLGKFAGAIQRVSIRFDDINGPKGSPSHRCAVKVVVTRHESVVVGVVAEELRGAFDSAIDAAERAVKKSLERVKSKARRR
ncbi:MAG TPA: HPF/RaiA family ribosome-associated protein [Gemmatimonadaceae bacterium]|jgi:ribosomal subunit interface protein|nr:HPF/RaiA family ribosome-associated protein [Gemmatimonadaceae bacterium]